MGNEPIEMPARPGAGGEPPEEDPRAICGHCHKRIEEVDLRFDVTPAGTLLLTFRCKHCKVFQGHQVVPPNWVIPQAIQEPGSPAPDVRRMLDDLRRRGAS